MLSFKEFIQEMNDNPDPEAVATQRREAIKSINKPGATKGEKIFGTAKLEALSGLNPEPKPTPKPKPKK